MGLPEVLVWALLFSVGRVCAQKYEGEDCQLKNGEDGVCKRITQCAAAGDQISAGKFPEICSYIRNTPVVCCSLDEQPTTPTTTTTTRRTTPRTTTTPRRTTPRRTTPRPTTPTTTAGRVTPKPRPILEMSGKSWEKCLQYSSEVRQEGYAPILVYEDEKVFDEDCAQSVQQLIINGEKVQPKEYPHMVALGFGDANNTAWSCGGSLISDRFVLTAAHCLFARGRGNVRWARVGDLNLYETTDESKPVTLEVIERIPHSGYKPPSHYNDIALLRLNASVKFNAYVRPACLHTNRTTPEENIATATGWGVTEWTADAGSKDLMKVDLRFTNPQRCNLTYQALITGSQRLTRGFQDDSMICAGDTTNQGRDTCVGDSGSPLQLRLTVPYCMYSIVGLTSFGVSACGVSNSPAVYTRVSHFVPWIESIVWPN